MFDPQLKSENLVNLESEASILDGKYIKQKTKSKHQEKDEYLVSNILTLEKKKVYYPKILLNHWFTNIMKNIMLILKSHNTLPMHLLRKIGLVYSKLYSELKTASNNISGFSDELITLYQNYDMKDIFNID